MAGLDPDFTANAWGPTYLGAMACHYLDIALVVGVSGWLLDKILPRLPDPGEPGVSQRWPGRRGCR